jgi:hypothetical protein
VARTGEDGAVRAGGGLAVRGEARQCAERTDGVCRSELRKSEWG